MSLFDDFSKFLESRLEEFLHSNPHLELQALSEQLKEQQRDTSKSIYQLQQEEKRIELEILKVAKDIKTWHQRIDKAKSAGRFDLAAEAQTRETNLLHQGNLLWGQMQGVKQRVSKSQELLISIEQKQKEVTLKIAQLKASQNSNQNNATDFADYKAWNNRNNNYSRTSVDSLEDKFQQWEMDQELEQMKRNLNK